MATIFRNERPGYSLNVSVPFIQGVTNYFDFAALAEDFSARNADEGSDVMRFSVSVESGVSIAELTHWFETLLGYDMKMEVNNSVVWRGFLKSMILSVGGDAEIRDLEFMANAYTVEYKSEDTTVETPIMVSPFSGTESQAFYGVKIKKFSFPDLEMSDALEKARKYLKYNTFPRARPYSGDKRDILQFEFVGYLWMLDWCPDELATGITRKSALEQVVTNCGQGIITFNGTSIQDNGKFWNTDEFTGTGLQIIREVTNVLDTDDFLWRFYLSTDLVLHWEPIDFLPYYTRRYSEIESGNGVFIGLSGSQKVKSETAQAGRVIRNTAYPVTIPEVGSPFWSRQDRYVEAVVFNSKGEVNFESLNKYPEVSEQTEEYT